jgi:hypothetical protein
MVGQAVSPAPDVILGIPLLRERLSVEYRLGDIIDDFCVKCKQIMNHSIVSILNSEPAKVRCRTCHSDHDYRHEKAPPSKTELKKAALFQEVLSKTAPQAEPEPELEPEPEPEPEVEVVAAPAPKAKPKAKPAKAKSVKAKAAGRKAH